SAYAISLVDSAAQSVRRLPIALAPGERFDAVGFTPRGANYVVVVGRGAACPCRVVVRDAANGKGVGGGVIGATALDTCERDAGRRLARRLGRRRRIDLRRPSGDQFRRPPRRVGDLLDAGRTAPPSADQRRAGNRQHRRFGAHVPTGNRRGRPGRHGGRLTGR